MRMHTKTPQIWRVSVGAEQKVVVCPALHTKFCLFSGNHEIKRTWRFFMVNSGQTHLRFTGFTGAL